MHTQILILGSGPAGCTAALYSVLAGFKTTILMGILPGGQLIFSHEIENFPGYSTVSGMDLTDCFQEQIRQTGAHMIFENAEQADFSKRPFCVQTGLGTTITADSVIIATGSSARWLHLPGERSFIGHGISICATCDGPFFKGKSVAVIGGGNTAAYEALYLANLCSKIFVIFPDQKLRAEHYLIKKISKKQNIVLMPHHQALSFEGDKKLHTVTVKDIKDQTHHHLAVAGAFEAVGHLPNTHLFNGQLDMDSDGYILTDPETLQTSVPGVFACGDVRATPFRQAVIAAGSGCTAALSAKKFLI